jgi:hypothetical protein
VSLPTTGYILSLLRKESETGYNYFNFDDLLKLALLKFPGIPLQKSIRIILGSVSSSNTYIHFSIKK